MIEKLKTTVTVEARKETTNAVYQINYSAVDGQLSGISSSVSKKVTVPVEGSETAEQQVYAGNIYLNNGNVTCSIPQENDVATYMAEFMTIVEEIGTILNAPVSE